MRIIAGQFGGRFIKGPPDHKTRPTSDRLRETLFNILNPRIDADTRFLDLCSGTGAVGIEAISRGSAFSGFVDKSRRSCGLIEENLDQLDISETQTKVICNTAEHYLGHFNGIGWDIVFYDPPYKVDYQVVLKIIGNPTGKILNSGGILIVEHHFKNALPEVSGSICLTRLVKQGESCLSFFENSPS